MSLKKSSSTGNDELSSRTLQSAAIYIASPLTSIINMSFIHGVFPSSFKIAKVIPVYKKGKTDNVQNYRPISLLSNLSKVVEKLMFNRIFKFLSSNNLLYDKQFGFR